MQNVTNTRQRYLWLYDMLFLLVLFVAGYLRLSGVDWGELQHQHPDENHFSSVLDSLRAHKCQDEAIPVDACPPEQRRWLSLGDYLDSDTSTLSPYNRGFSFYVYGNLPMTILRVAAEATDQVNLRVFGRQFAALADLFSILFLYLIVARLYGRPVALLASLFSALAVMQIQQSHFFTTDLFVNTFAFLAIYFAVSIMQSKEPEPKTTPQETEAAQLQFSAAVAQTSSLQLSDPQSPAADLQSPSSNSPIANSPTSDSPATEPLISSSPVTNYSSFLSHPLFLLSIGFGIAYGMALASKVNIYPLAVLLPGAFLIRHFMLKRSPTLVETAPGEALGESEERTAVVHYQSPVTRAWMPILVCLIVGGLAAVISFRFFQPYAFDGLGLNPQWVANIREQRVQATGGADVPWELQWARRTHLYSFENLTIWGLGLPLGILAWVGFLYMGWRILNGEWQHALLWGWTAAYFVWQSLQFNPTMRYQLPIYPLLAMMAAWFIFELAKNPQTANDARSTGVGWLRPVGATVLGLTVLALTAAWAFAFQSIYVRDEPRIAASRWIYQNIPGALNLRIQTTDGRAYNQPLPFVTGSAIQADQPYSVSFIPAQEGQITGFYFPHVADEAPGSDSEFSLVLSEGPNPTPDLILAQSSARIDHQTGSDSRGGPISLVLDKPIPAVSGKSLWLTLQTSNSLLTLSSAAIANETDYDYAIPFRIESYDPFGGLYNGLNLQVYWDDNADKLTRFIDTLNQTDYILIPTNHQYAQITRLPERYPLTTYYYRELMGCPPEIEIIPCYHEAKPGNYKGRLGFELVAVFETFPKLGPIEINDQYAEEAFTFYDHPKAFIFKKNADFDIEQVRSSLSTVDLSKMVRLTPRQFDEYSDLLLPADRLSTQRTGGTWSQLFDYDWIQNRYPLVGLLIWYLFTFILGLATYPLIRLAMPGLADKGYPLSRALGLVIFGYLAWMTGSVGISVTRSTVAIIFGLLLMIGAVLGHLQRDELLEEWRTRGRYFLMVEGLFLFFFLFDLLIRLGNPDMWHIAKGGERPMDFSYFNAIIKSTTFPPYDPWFAGGYINYYYYGFVLVAMPVKLLGVVPSIAYNFILPTLFAMVGICAFSIGWNLLSKDESGRQKDEEIIPEPSSFTPALPSSVSAIQPSALIAGLAAAALAILLGNLGTIQLLYNKLQFLGALGTFTWDSTFPQRLTWASAGLKMLFNGATLPIGPGDWYWDPSRVIPPGPGNEITEFPLFTFIYSDLHAHMMVMPIALLALSWALSVVAGRVRWQNPAAAGLGIVLGGIIIGAAYPANLSDAYTYLLIGMIALAYSIWRYAEAEPLKRIALILAAVMALYGLSTYLYLPYRTWYAQAYSALDPWKGPFTPVTSYLTHWGVFLFIIVSWLAWETREWMAQTPLSALRKLKPYQWLIEGALILFVIALLAIQYFVGTSIGWLALPIAAWSGVLILNPKLPDAKRLVLFLIGTAMFITVFVDIVVVRGDIGRANTIFKFYLQAWLMLAVSAGAMCAWLLAAFFKWLPGWRAFWQTAMILLVGGAAMFTVTGAQGKIQDRWIPDAPHSLDAMTFMNYAQHNDFGQPLDLSEDYRAIRWLQDNVQGSPVIVEANCTEYRWCTRFTIYTGLPGVVGWNFHQRQQRAFTSQWVEQRVAAVGNFYNSVDAQFSQDFLKTYDVKYILVGQLERAAYTPEGIAKFEQFDGELWKSVYRDGNTVIYEVIP